MAASLPIPVFSALDKVHGGDVSVALKTRLAPTSSRISF